MDPAGAAPRSLRDSMRPWLRYALLGLVVAMSVVFFLHTGDPMILIFGMMACGLLWLLVGPRRQGASWRPEVRVRCRACGHLNPEDARYCNQCGKAP